VTPILQLTVYPLGPLPGPIRFNGKFRLFAVQFGGLCAAAMLGNATIQAKAIARETDVMARPLTYPFPFIYLFSFGACCVAVPSIRGAARIVV
jgi:hypothetical protein